ncbi:hypothetical protein [Vibrio fortis]|uniref:hypothetical protein n=1 Tax=Vibrio fortis TaxID=212667 RepID=UPI003EBCEA61
MIKPMSLMVIVLAAAFTTQVNAGTLKCEGTGYLNSTKLGVSKTILKTSNNDIVLSVFNGYDESLTATYQAQGVVQNTTHYRNPYGSVCIERLGSTIYSYTDKIVMGNVFSKCISSIGISSHRLW